MSTVVKKVNLVSSKLISISNLQCCNYYQLENVSSLFHFSQKRRSSGNCRDDSSKVRVRFAPSPTGFIHLGGLRTAFYNYLFAKKYDGKFIVRIEDTDQTRIVPGSLEHIIDTLKWSGLVPDEGPTFGGQYGPYIQSERTDLYREMVDKLLQTDTVYRCFCTPKRLELLRREAAKNRETIRYDNRCRSLTSDEIKQNIRDNKPHTVRLRLKEGPMVVQDIVYGSVTYDLSRIEGDPIIFKSDNLPTYHFANVVDDHFMKISHVLRGTEWLISTPKHLMLYEAFGWPAPRYAHLPLIVNKDGTKLSKRHDHIRLDTYRSQGYYPQTIINYLTQMGGGFSQLDTVRTEKIYSLQTLSQEFNLESVNQNSCRIDADKVKLLNRLLIQNLCETNIERLVDDLRLVLLNENRGDCLDIDLNDNVYIRKVIEWSLDRIYTLKDLVGDEFNFLWSPPKYCWKLDNVDNRLIVSILNATIQELIKSDVCFDNKDQLLEILRRIQSLNEKQIKFGTFMKLLRYSLTNLKAGSPVAETLWLLGKDRSIHYLKNAANYINDDIDGMEEHRQQ